VFERVEWASQFLGLSQAGVLAQIVISGDGLGQRAQLALVMGMVACQILALLLAHSRRSRKDDDE